MSSPSNTTTKSASFLPSAVGDLVTLSKEPLSIDALVRAVTRPQCGAIATFLGTTRDHFDGREVVRLEYEAYEAMAVRGLHAICDAARTQWPDIGCIAIAHRLDVVPVGEASVIIAVSSPHRRVALDAVSYVIDELKRSVTIWKREVYGGRAPGDGSGVAGDRVMSGGSGGSAETSAWKVNAECFFAQPSAAASTPAVERPGAPRLAPITSGARAPLLAASSGTARSDVGAVARLTDEAEDDEAVTAATAATDAAMAALISALDSMEERALSGGQWSAAVPADAWDARTPTRVAPRDGVRDAGSAATLHAPH